MRFDASLFPKFRKEKIEEAEQVSNPGTVGYQCIHIGRPVLQLLPGMDEEVASQPENNRRRKKPGDISGIRHIHEKHTDHGYRKGQKNDSDGFPLEFLIILAADFFGFFGCFFFLADQQIISGILHGFLQGFRRTDERIIFHCRRCCRIIHLCQTDTRLLIQGFVHPIGTCRTTHSHHRKGSCCCFRLRHDLFRLVYLQMKLFFLFRTHSHVYKSR